jgi:hypothetical protein
MVRVTRIEQGGDPSLFPFDKPRGRRSVVPSTIQVSGFVTPQPHDQSHLVMMASKNLANDKRTPYPNPLQNFRSNHRAHLPAQL